ncbi:MAG: caspase family protein [Bacteroidetes bacterium]|nr:caspase family protein [Bacteroidota bacterium]
MKKSYFILLLIITIKTFAQNPELMIPRGHAEGISDITISPNDKWLASGSSDKSVRIWDATSGRELKAYENFPNWVYSVMFSNDSKLLVAGSYKEMRVFDMTNGKQIFKKVVHANDIRSLAFSDDSKILATASTFDKPGASSSWSEIRTWNTNGFTQLNRIEVPGEIKGLRFDNNELLVMEEGKIVHVNTLTGTILKTESFGEETPYVLSPDGKWYVGEGFDMGDGSSNDIYNSLSLDDNDDENPQGKHATVTIINRISKQVVKVFKGQTSSIKDMCFSPDSRYLTTAADDNTIFIYDLQAMKRVGKLTDKKSYPKGLAFSSNCKIFYSGNYDKIIRVYDFEKRELIRKLGGTANTIYNLDISKQTNVLSVISDQAFFSNGYLSTIDLTSGTLSRKYSSNSYNSNLQYSFDGKLLLAGDFGKLRLWDAVTGGEKNVEDNDVISVSDMSKDGKLFATSVRADAPTLLIRSLPDAAVISTIKLPANAYTVLFSDDGQYLFVGLTRGDKTLKIDVSSGNVVQTFKHDGEYADQTGIKQLLLVNNSSTLIAGDDYGHIRFYNTSTAQETYELKGVKERINRMIALPNNRFAVCSGESAFPDSTIKIIDISTKTIVARLSGHKNSATSLALSNDGKFLFSGSYDRTINVWNLSTYKLAATIVLFGEDDWVVVDNDGRFDGTQNAMKQLYYVRGLDYLPLESGFEQFYTPGLLPRILGSETFAPPIVNINTIKPAPKVKIMYNPVLRNLELAGDTSTFNVKEQQLTITVNAEAADDVIDEIRLYQNGKLITTTARNLVVDNDKSAIQTKTFNIVLNNGTNSLKAIAINSQRTESLPDVIILNYTPSQQNIADDNITLHLMVVGVNTYKNPKYNLNYAKADATSFKDEIEKNSTGIFSSVKLHFLMDADAVKDNIESCFKTIAQEAKPQDVFIFYYAGHGIISMNDKQKDFYIVPYDVLQLYGADDALAQKGISATEMQEFSKNIPAQKQLFILDACQSAGALDAVAMRGAAEEKAIAQLARSTGTHWLTASGSEQFAEEFSQLGHGVFTYALLKALSGDAANGDNQITVNELKAYLENAVPELSRKYKGQAQYPASYGFGNDFPVEVLK